MSYPYPDYSLHGKDSKRAAELGLIDAKWYQSPVPKQEMKKLLARKNGPAIIDTLIWLSLLIASGVGGYVFWGTLWAIIPFSIYGVLYGTACDSRWHESNHGTAFKTDWMNKVLYELSSFMVVRESVLWRWTHVRHHSDTLITGSDPEIAAQRPPKLWMHIINMFNLRVWLIYIKSVSLHFIGRVSDVDKNLIPENDFKKLFIGARIIVLVYAVVVGLSIYLDSILPLLYVGLPSIYGAWLMPIYSLTQHSGLKENVLDHRENCRTIYINRVNRFIYWNMNYHLEHHMFPLVPYHALPKLHELVKNDSPKPYKSLLSAWKEIFPAWRKQKKDPDYFVKLDIPQSVEKALVDDRIVGDDNEVENNRIFICKTGELLPGDIRRFDLNDRSYSIYHTNKNKYYATDGYCTHGNSHLSEGMLVDELVECSKHNGRFDIKDGSARRSPVCDPINTYEIIEESGHLWLNLHSIKKVEEKRKGRTAIYRVVSNKMVATYIKELILEPETNNLKYRSGGYIHLEIPPYKLFLKDLHISPSYKEAWDQKKYQLQSAKNNVTLTRNYSMASNAHTDKNLTFNVRIHLSPNGESIHAGIGSSYVFQLKPGDLVKVYGPFGDFHIKEDSKKEIVYIGGGAGMAPIKSHISYLFETLKTKRKVSYWYGARAKRDIFYEEYFTEIADEYDNFSFTIALSEPDKNDSWDSNKGFIHEICNKEYLSKVEEPGNLEYYLCGPPAMIDNTLKMLEQLGVSNENIFYDAY